MPIYEGIYDGPPRWYTERRTDKRWLMIHATANTASAEDEASYAKRRPDRVSSHYYVDDDSMVQSLDTDLIAWHAGNTEGNAHAISYELTKKGTRRRAWWLDHGNVEWPLMVAAIARDCREHNIDPRELSDAQLRRGESGFTTHVQGNRVWGGSDHTDPGPHFPMDHLVRQVRAALEDDVSWDQRLKVPGWFEENFPGNFEEGEATARLFVTAGYGYSRLSYRQGEELAAGLAAVLARLDGADEGATRQVVREELDRHRGEVTDMLQAASDERDELADLVRRRDELGAEAIVDELARRLADDADDA